MTDPKDENTASVKENDSENVRPSSENTETYSCDYDNWSSE